MIDIYTPNEVYNFANQYAYKRTQFCSILEVNGNEVIENVYAFRKVKKIGLEIMLVIRRSTDNNKTYVRGLTYSNIYGYSSTFICEDWDITYKELGLSSVVLNLDILKETKYKYLVLSKTCPVIKIIKLYNEYPAVEFFLKLKLPLSKNMLKLAINDKSFRKFLFNISYKDKFLIYNSTQLIFSYKNKCSFEFASNYLDYKRYFNKYFKRYNLDSDKTIKYFIKNNIRPYSYSDYYNACLYLKLDMSLDKNLYPHNFERMHDLRIQEYASAKEKEDAKKKRAFNKKFKNISKKYSFMNYDKDFTLIIAPTVLSLIKEGNELKHCVGKMGYDKKMVNEESLIFFIREKEHINKPFVTLEYSLENKKILQIYGYGNTDPSEAVMKFANHWCKIATNRLKKIA